MAPRRHENNEYYAVFCGRVDEPTIFSSWYFLSYIVMMNRLITSNRGDAHPRVTGCPSEHKAFVTIEDARLYMKKKGVMKAKEVIKKGAGETTPLKGDLPFYAVAHGKHPGIYPNWQYDVLALSSS